ncbi:hypothetical protein [Streptomyces sp. NPDC059142]|uniref:MmyB family transcriptional regulator n=1 Tax=Streptomyces sp. NPDC059142 TaxID=3346739 RepID=UPI00367DE78C
MNVIGANTLGRALYQPMYGAYGNAHTARFVFTDPSAQTFWRDGDVIADDTAHALRAESGSTPCDRELTDLTDELKDLQTLAAKACPRIISDEAGPASNRVVPEDWKQWRADLNRLRTVLASPSLPSALFDVEL